MTPTINTASNITVAIEPQLVRFVRNKTAPDGNTYPVVATKEIKTVFALENGKTAAIGGLTENTDRDVVSKIPQPQSIIKESGLPEDTDLTRKKMIRASAEKMALEANLEKAREAADKESSETSGKVKSRLLKRRN